jgi:hypothetical protein
MQTSNILFNENETCIICYKSLTVTNNCTTGCGHTFCLSCLLRRISNRAKCPYCNESLTDTMNIENDSVDSNHSSITEHNSSVDDNIYNPPERTPEI